MIQNEIDKLIANAMKEGDKTRLDSYRAVKTAFMEFRTAKNAKPLDEAAEINIIRKMIKERRDSAEEYNRVFALTNDEETKNRAKLNASKELAEADCLEIEFMPVQPDYEDIEAYALEIITEKNPRMMGTYIKMLKEKFPTADGKTLSECVKSLI